MKVRNDFILSLQKYLEAEDETEEYRKQMEEKVEFLESQNRMLELKIKNASDHGMYSIYLTHSHTRTPFDVPGKQAF